MDNTTPQPPASPEPPYYGPPAYYAPAPAPRHRGSRWRWGLAGGVAATEAQSKGVLLVESTLTNGAGAGTAMVLDSSGLALTNYHVVENSTTLQATVASTGATYDATVVGFDKKSDVALIQLDGAS